MMGRLRDVLNQLWTLLGMYALWVTLVGSAKYVIGVAIVGTFIVWVLSYNIREGGE